jgi:hypothetical protein
VSQTLVKFAIRHRYSRGLYRLSTRLRDRITIFAALLFIALAFTVFLSKWSRIAHYLYGVDPAAIYQLSISVGAALIGLIAVVFTLSLFVVQQISNTSIPGLLGEYAADPFSQLIYVILAILAVLALGCSLIVPSHHPFVQVALIAFCVLGSLILLWLLFERVAVLCDPSNVIQYIRTRGLRELLTLEHLRQAVLDINPALAQAKVRFDQDAETIPSALALLRHYNPSLTHKYERGLRQLYTLMRVSRCTKN